MNFKSFGEYSKLHISEAYYKAKQNDLTEKRLKIKEKETKLSPTLCKEFYNVNISRTMPQLRNV